MNASTESSTGASSIWTSLDPTICKGRELYYAGRLREAEEVLRSAAAGNGEAAEFCDLISRLRFEYSLTPEKFENKLRDAIPDISASDIAKWLKTGELQARTIEGQPMIYRREPSNLFRFCPEAIRRRVTSNPPRESVLDFLGQIVAEAKSTGNAEVCPQHFHLRYTLKILGNPSVMKKGSTLRAWLPMPQEYRYQKSARLISTNPAGGVVAPNGSPQRSIYLEKKITDPAAEQIVSAEYEVDVYSYYPALSESKVEPLPADFPREYLSERLPHIALSPDVKKLAAEITAGQSNSLAAAMAIFRWIDKNIAYHAEDEYCLTSSISTKALKLRRGDCGVLALVFITLCRAAGIPARWQSGWRLASDHDNMHDWAEFYIHPFGWLPADPSDGLQKSDDPAIRDFYLGHIDSYRMIVNLDYGRPLIPPKHSLRSEPADFQRGEVEVDGVNLYFNQWDYQMERVGAEKLKS